MIKKHAHYSVIVSKIRQCYFPSLRVIICSYPITYYFVCMSVQKKCNFLPAIKAYFVVMISFINYTYSFYSNKYLFLCFATFLMLSSIPIYIKSNNCCALACTTSQITRATIYLTAPASALLEKRAYLTAYVRASAFFSTK